MQGFFCLFFSRLRHDFDYLKAGESNNPFSSAQNVKKEQTTGPLLSCGLDLGIAKECVHIPWSQALLELKGEEIKFCKQSSERRRLVPGKNSLRVCIQSGLNWQLQHLWEAPE